jgi:hypothetical protein
MSYTPEQILEAINAQHAATGRVPAWWRESYQVDPSNRWWERWGLDVDGHYFYDPEHGWGVQPSVRVRGVPVPGYRGPHVWPNTPYWTGPDGEPKGTPYGGPWFGAAGLDVWSVVPEYAMVDSSASATHSVGTPHYAGYGGSVPGDRDGVSWVTSPIAPRGHHWKVLVRQMTERPELIERYAANIDQKYLGAAAPAEPAAPVIEPPATSEPAPAPAPAPEPSTGTYPWGQPAGAPVPDAQPPAEPAAPVPAEQPEPVPTYPWSQPGGAPVPDPQAPQPDQPATVAAPAADEPGHTYLVVEALYRLLCEGRPLTIQIVVNPVPEPDIDG